MSALLAELLELRRELAELRQELSRGSAVPGLLEATRTELVALRADVADVLDVAAVRSRYGLSDPRAARAVMRQAGGTFTVGRRLLVHRATLEAWERDRAGATLALEEPAAPQARTRRRHAERSLPPDFWRAGR